MELGSSREATSETREGPGGVREGQEQDRAGASTRRKRVHSEPGQERERRLEVDDGTSPLHDFERLEQLVMQLTRGYEWLRGEDAALRSRIETRENRIHRLDAEIRAANQKRQNAVKHLDELLLQIDRLETGLVESTSEGAVPLHRTGADPTGAAAAKAGQ